MYEADGIVRVYCILDDISIVVLIIGVVRMAGRVMKFSRGSIVNITGDIGVPGNEVVSDAVKVHDDSGELHTKTGIYMVVPWYTYTYMDIRRIYTWIYSSD